VQSEVNPSMNNS